MKQRLVSQIFGLLLLTSLSTPLVLAAGPYSLSKELAITQAEVDLLQKKLPTLPSTQAFYHYAPLFQGLRWVRQKHVDQGEMEALNAGSGAAGGGLYLAAGPESSKGFGAICIVFEVKAGTPVYDEKIVSDILKDKLKDRQPDAQKLNALEKVKLGELIPFLHFYGGAGKDWWVTHHWKNSQSIVASGNNEKYGIKVNLQGLFLRSNRVDSVSELEQYAEDGKDTLLRDNVGWLKSFFHLMSYVDGIALARTMTVRPENPWLEFEPEHFEAYRKVRETFLKQLAPLERKGTTLGISTLGKFEGPPFEGPPNVTQAAWVKKQVRYVLPLLVNLIGGKLNPEKLPNQKELDNLKDAHVYRTGPVRGGGNEYYKPGDPKDRSHGFFFASDGQISVMKANPYLTVDQQACDKVRKGCYVAYYYPDVNHYQTLVKAGYVNSTLAAEIRKHEKEYDPSTVEEPNAITRTMNGKLVKALLTGLFTRIHGKSIMVDVHKADPKMKDDVDSAGLDALLGLVSIHPFDDYNGRTTRFFIQYAHMEAHSAPPQSFVSDLDLLTPPEIYGRFVEISTSFNDQVRNEMIAQLIGDYLDHKLESNHEKRGKRYFSLPGWNHLLSSSLGVFGIKIPADQPFKFSAKQLELIEKRRFVGLFDELAGPESWLTRAPMLPKTVH